MENRKMANAPDDPNRKIYIRVPFKEKKVAIGFGAVFDTDRNRWCVTQEQAIALKEVEPFKFWLPEDALPAAHRTQLNCTDSVVGIEREAFKRLTQLSKAATPEELRQAFAAEIMNCGAATNGEMWLEFKEAMAGDLQQRGVLGSEVAVVAEIELLLMQQGKARRPYPPHPSLRLAYHIRPRLSRRQTARPICPRPLPTPHQPSPTISPRRSSPISSSPRSSRRSPNGSSSSRASGRRASTRSRTPPRTTSPPPAFCLPRPARRRGPPTRSHTCWPRPRRTRWLQKDTGGRSVPSTPRRWHSRRRRRSSVSRPRLPLSTTAAVAVAVASVATAAAAGVARVAAATQQEPAVVVAAAATAAAVTATAAAVTGVAVAATAAVVAGAVAAAATAAAVVAGAAAAAAVAAASVAAATAAAVAAATAAAVAAGMGAAAAAAVAVVAAVAMPPEAAGAVAVVAVAATARWRQRSATVAALRPLCRPAATARRRWRSATVAARRPLRRPARRHYLLGGWRPRTPATATLRTGTTRRPSRRHGPAPLGRSPAAAAAQRRAARAVATCVMGSAAEEDTLGPGRAAIGVEAAAAAAAAAAAMGVAAATVATVATLAVMAAATDKMHGRQPGLNWDPLTVTLRITNPVLYKTPPRAGAAPSFALECYYHGCYFTELERSLRFHEPLSGPVRVTPRYP